MKILLALLRKEFKQIFRDPMIIRIIFIVPVIQLLILPFAADFEIQNINVGIIDHDHSDYSREIVQKIEFSEYFNLTGYSNSYNEAVGWLENENADLFIEIPANFESRLIREKGTDIFMGVNAVNGTKGNIGAAYAMNVIRKINQQIQSQWIDFPSEYSNQSIRVKHSNWYNPYSNYQKFMVPGILAILLTLVGVFLSAVNIVREKEIGTIEQLNVSPIRKTQFILGKIIPFWILGIVILTIGLIVSYIVHSIVPGANIGVLYLFAFVYLVSILGFGLLLSNYTETQQQAMMVAFFFMMIFILMSGLFTPIESMPDWAQYIARLNPVTYMVDVMRMVLLKGAYFTDIIPHLKTIAVEGLIFNSLAIWSYRKRG